MSDKFPSEAIEAVSEFHCFAHPSEETPPSPDFLFGPVSGDVMNAFFAAKHMSEIGVYECRDIAVVDAFLYRFEGAFLSAPQVNLHADKILTAIETNRLRPQKQVLQNIIEPCVAIIGPGYNVFGHWIVDFIPKLYLLNLAGHDIAKLLYILPVDAPKYGPLLLEMLGIGRDRIIFVDYDRDHIFARRLLIPTKMHNGVRVSRLLRDTARFLRSRVEQTAGRSVLGGQAARVLISRSGWKSRTLRNRDEIEAIVTEAGFERRNPESFGLFEQVCLFANAREIITEYGSGAHSTIFGDAGLTLSALRGSSFQPMFIQSGIGAALEQQTGYVFGATEPNDGLQAFSVAPDDVAHCIATVFSRKLKRPAYVPDVLVAFPQRSGTELDQWSCLSVGLHIPDATADDWAQRWGPQAAGPGAGRTADACDDASGQDVPCADHSPGADLAERPTHRAGGRQAAPKLAIDFGWTGNSFLYCKRGWSGAQPGHRWTLGPRTELVFKVRSQHDGHLIRVSLSPLTKQPEWPVQRLNVSASGVSLAYFEVRRPSILEFYIPAALLPRDGRVRLEFRHPDHVSPLRLGTSGDERDLAFAFFWMTVAPAAYPVASRGR